MGVYKVLMQVNICSWFWFLSLRVEKLESRPIILSGLSNSPVFEEIQEHQMFTSLDLKLTFTVISSVQTFNATEVWWHHLAEHKVTGVFFLKNTSACKNILTWRRTSGSEGELVDSSSSYIHVKMFHKPILMKTDHSSWIRAKVQTLKWSYTQWRSTHTHDKNMDNVNTIPKELEKYIVFFHSFYCPIILCLSPCRRDKMMLSSISSHW